MLYGTVAVTLTADLTPVSYRPSLLRFVVSVSCHHRHRTAFSRVYTKYKIYIRHRCTHGVKIGNLRNTHSTDTSNMDSSSGSDVPPATAALPVVDLRGASGPSSATGLDGPDEEPPEARP